MSKREFLKPIQSSGDVQYDIYRVVTEVFCPYRSITITSKIVGKDELLANMEFDKYTKIDAKKASGERLAIVILSRNKNEINEITTITEKFKLFINNIRSQNDVIMLISPNGFATHVLNYIHDNEINKMLFRYNYDTFKTVVPLGPYCSKHTVLTPEEAEYELNVHRLDPKEMKRIRSYDPMAIWEDAKPGDIIKIERINNLTGGSEDLRKVVKSEPF